MIRNLRVAIGFLTRLPVSPPDIQPDDLGQSVKYFPLVGVIYGALTWGLLQLLSRFFVPEIAAWLTVFGGAFLNGCIHWDGFSDTADGLGSNDPAKSLTIMKDSRLGAFGGMALIFLILGKIFAIKELLHVPLLTFIAVAVLSRWGMTVQIYTQPSVSQGLLKSFQIKNKLRDLLISTILMLILIGFAWPVNLLFLAFTLIVLLVIKPLIKKRFGGITGDILGAVNELIELVCLLGLIIRH